MAAIHQKNQVHWETVVKPIQEQKCILCIGPDLFTSGEGCRLEDQMAQHLHVEENQHIRNHYAKDGMFLFDDETGRTFVYYELKAFFSQPCPDSALLLEKIAQIPFHVIFTVTPDHHLEEIFKQHQFDYQAGFYWKNRPSDEEMRPPTPQHPLIYNIFGSIDELDSLVLTYQDLFDYFDSMLGGGGLPAALTKSLQKANEFIFLGISFEKWYMQLLLRILAKQVERKGFIRYAAVPKLEEDIKVFCEEQFKIIFVEGELRNFVDGLFEECRRQDFIRKPSPREEPLHHRIAEFIAKAELQTAIKELRAYLENTEGVAQSIRNTMAILESRYHQLRQDINTAVISSEEKERRQNQIAVALLDLVQAALNNGQYQPNG